MKRYGHGHMLWLVHHKGGIFQKLNKDLAEEIDAMGAVLDWNIFPNPGDRVSPTTDCFTWGGLVIMFHVDRAHVEKDYARIREMELSGLFEIVEDSNNSATIATSSASTTAVADLTAKLSSLSAAVQSVFANTTINVGDVIDCVFGSGKVTSLTDNQAGVVLDSWTVKFEMFIDKALLKVIKSSQPTSA